MKYFERFLNRAPKSGVQQDFQIRYGSYEKLNELAEAKNMKIGEYCKWILTEHAKTMY
jgi:hypothetical protein